MPVILAIVDCGHPEATINGTSIWVGHFAKARELLPC